MLGTRLGEATSFWDQDLVPIQGFLHGDLDPGVLVASTARFPDQADELKEAGVDDVFDFANEAGTAFADRIADRVLTAPT